MLDGRIDTQGTVKDLRARGILDDITHEESIEAHREEQVAAAEEAAASESADNGETIVDAQADENGKPAAAAKKPRKLIEEEKRETGSVKWRIYNTYLKASCVVVVLSSVRHCALQNFYMCFQLVLDLGYPYFPHFTYTSALQVGLLFVKDISDETFFPSSWALRKRFGSR